MVSEVSATSCAQLFVIHLCRVSVRGSVSRHIVKVGGRAAGASRKERIRSIASTRWARAASARRAHAHLFGSCRVARASRELRDADGGNQEGLVRAPNHLAKINYWYVDTIHVQSLITRKLWAASTRPSNTVSAEKACLTRYPTTRVKEQGLSLVVSTPSKYS